MSDLLLGIDVGATSIKAGVFDPSGNLIAVANRRNAPIPDPQGQPGWLVWDPEEIWQKVCSCIRDCLTQSANKGIVRAVACTGFGTDGLPLDANGRVLYPFISWHCGRTVPQRDEMNRRIGDARIFNITGYHNYHINTANRFLWIKQNRPDVLANAKHWLQVQDFIAFRLSSAYSTECTIASTTMLLDLAARSWSKVMLEACEVDPYILPTISEAGTQIGEVSAAAAHETGLRPGTPVVTGGHDCELAVLGAGVDRNTTWIDITGTWEILIATVDRFQPNSIHFERGLDFECHAIPNQWICQSLMIAGAVTEWVRENFYSNVSNDPYARMFGEADVDSNGVYLLPSFMRGMGPDAARKALGAILGLQTMTSRGQVVRAALEGLCYQLHRQIHAIVEAVGYSPDRLRVIGGGQKNPLWIQLKADITGLPIEVISIPEVTLLGAAMLAGVGAGVFKSVPDALGRVNVSIETTEPRAHMRSIFAERYAAVYSKLADSLSTPHAAIDAQLNRG